MTPYWYRSSGLAFMLAPTSMMTTGPWCEGKMAAIPGRRTPGRNILALNSAEATIAPVLPAETTALTSPPAIRAQHREIELSRFRRSASTGLSSIVTIWLAWTTGSRSRGASCARASSASTRSRSPTRTTVSPGSSRTASTAPATIGPGAKSPPMASRAILMAVSGRGEFGSVGCLGPGWLVARRTGAGCHGDGVRGPRAGARPDPSLGNPSPRGRGGWDGPPPGAPQRVTGPVVPSRDAGRSS